MNDLRQAAQQALEDICGAKLCEVNSMSSRTEMLRLMDKAITALRAALEEPNRAQKLTEAGYTRRPTLREMAEPVLNPAPGYCKHCKQYTIEEPLPAEPVEPVAGNWSVFNTGAEVFSGMSLPEAVAELTPARLERGWSAVCVINKDNPPTYAAPQRKPLTEEEIDSIWDSEKVFADIYAIARAVEAAHGIK